MFQGWMVRVCRCEEAERQDEEADPKKKSKNNNRFSFPVFAIVCTKFKKMEHMTPVIEFSPNEKTVERLTNVDDLKERIRSIQKFAALCHKISNENRASQDLFIELMDPKSSKEIPKYTLFVVDRPCKTTQKFAAFVVPQGR